MSYEGGTTMITIGAWCPFCGRLELMPQQVRLVVCNVESWSFYAFTCPTCHEEVRKPAPHDVVTLLVSGNVVAEPWNVPAEALEDHNGPALNHDDMLDFVLRLDQTDLLAEAASR
jgi:hypothetical protein